MTAVGQDLADLVLALADRFGFVMSTWTTVLCCG